MAPAFLVIFIAFLQPTTMETLDRELLTFGIVTLLVIVAYQLHLARAGQSVGKRLLHLRVVREDGSRASVLRILARNTFSLLACITPFLLLMVFADAVAIFGPEQRCIHDLMTRTRVVKVPDDRSASR